MTLSHGRSRETERILLPRPLPLFLSFFFFSGKEGGREGVFFWSRNNEAKLRTNNSTYSLSYFFSRAGKRQNTPLMIDERFGRNFTLGFYAILFRGLTNRSPGARNNYYSPLNQDGRGLLGLYISVPRCDKSSTLYCLAAAVNFPRESKVQY